MTRGTAAWPGAVWASPLLRGLDERGPREIEASGSLLEKASGDPVYADGEPADVVYVVAKGEVTMGSLMRGAKATRTKRRAIEGDAVGEEALLGPHAVRDGDASCTTSTTLAAVPFVMLDRALVRAGGAELKERTARVVRRRLLEHRLRASGLLDGLDEASVGELLDAAAHQDAPRGETLAQPTDLHDKTLFLLDGLLGIHDVDEGGRPSPVGYLGRGDLFHEASRSTFGVNVSASGPSSVVFFPKALFEAIVARGTGSVARASRGHLPEPRAVDTKTTAHLVQDLYRVQIARSLLVIDQDSCVRCGQCVWSCGNAHDDGTPRLTRRGDKLLLPILDDRAPGTAKVTAVPLLLPNSCQHCKNPACLKDCPTAAIVRDGRGEVKIREDLCTGCGNCARGCPWENIQIVPRTPSKTERSIFPDVVVKCDLCEPLSHGPACVSACPTEAIVRIDPSATPLVGSKAGALMVVPRGRLPAWPWVALAVGLGLAAARVPLSSRGSGALAAGLSLAAAVSYLVVKRARPRAHANAKRPREAAEVASISTTRPHYVGHLAVGTFIVLVVAAHARAGGASPTGVASAVAFAVSVISGGLAAIFYVVVPPRLSRLEREGTLPEDLPRARDEQTRQLFRALSGRSELVKKIYDKVLAPYRARRLGAVGLVLSGRSVGREERRLRAEIDALLEGRGGEKLAGLGEVVKLVVEGRALRARAWLTVLLRGLPPIHVAAIAAFLVLLVAHAIVAWPGGR